jgi:integrase
MKLTQTGLAKLELDSGKNDQIFFDDEIAGFGLRVREGGSRKWVVHYRLGGLQRRHTIGNASVLPLEDARKKARKVLVAVDDGKDPAAEKATKRAASSLIFSAVAADYLAAIKSTMKPRSHVECTRHLNKAWKPIHGLALGIVSRVTVASRLREIAKASGPTAANRARATLSAMYAWAIGEGLCETNPVDGTNKADEGGARDRVLSDAELASVWNAAPESDYGRIVRLLMLTGQRRDEIGSLRWSEIDTKAKTITLPASRTKNGREHVVPLSEDALAVLDTVLHYEGRDLVFGVGTGGFSGWSKAKAALDEKLGKDLAAWTLHDLRRTGATRMADSGVQPHIIEAVLNHISGHKGGVAGVYNRAAYEPEKRAALDTLASYIKTAHAKAKGANVTRLQRA